MPKVDTTPAPLRPYLSHGVDASLPRSGDWTQGECPFCEHPRFGVQVDGPEGEVGRWKCFRCGRDGPSALTFLRELWTVSSEATTDYDDLSRDRGLLFPETLDQWGVCRSAVTRDWLVPGYGPGGKLDQLYRYVRGGRGKMELRATAGLHHALFGVQLYDATRPVVYLCEGPWDGMALWEVLKSAKRVGNGDGDDGKLAFTGSASASLLAGASVLAVPGCGSFDPRWCSLLAGKTVVILYDSDHPREVNGKTVPPAGREGVRRAAEVLARSESGRPDSVSYLCWGPDGYDPELPSGYDVRDWLRRGSAASAARMPDRVGHLAALLGRVQPVPAEWFARPAARVSSGKTAALTPIPCRSWKTLVDAWRRAMRWRRGLEDVLSVMLAVAASTDQSGNQLFLQVIGDAGTGKTQLCDGLLTSPHCFALEHLTGFHSGFNDGTGEDFSLIARINHKTLVTPEGDVMISSPRFPEIMSQQRRIFDGASGSTYKTSKEDRKYTGLRTPWIMAGTPTLMDSDQSRLGDRFLKVFLDTPDDEERSSILRRVGYSSLRAVTVTCNGQAGGHVSAEMREAYRTTGGYVDHLRASIESSISRVIVASDLDRVVAECEVLSEFTAAFRARPPSVVRGRDPEADDTKELPSRLQAQYARLAACLAVVLQRREIDVEVLRVVRKVAVDTSSGRTLRVGRELAASGREGLLLGQVAARTGEGEEKVRALLNFLRKIHVAERYAEPRPDGRRVGAGRWRLTRRMESIYQEVTRAH